MDELWIRLSWNLILCVPFGIFVWCLCQLPRIRTRPALRQGLWLLVLAKLVTPPLIPVPVLSATGVSVSEESIVSRDQAADQAVPPPVVLSADPHTLLTPTNMLTVQGLSFHESPTSSVTVSRTGTVTVGSWRNVTIALIVVSLAMTFSIWWASLRELRRLKRLLSSSRPHSDRASQILSRLAPQFRLVKIPELVVVESATAPVVWAGSKPAIVLSEQLVQSLNDDQLQHVLAHELAHLERRDHWTNLFAFFVATVCWWHPIAWLARREQCLAVELCCDALVLERCRGSRKSYAQTLLSVADYIAGCEPSRPALALSFDGTSLRKRIQMIADTAVNTRFSAWGWSLLGLVAATSLLLPARAQEQQIPKREPISKTDPDKEVPKPVTQSQDQVNAPFEAGKYYVTGTVIEKDTRTPVANVSVTFLVDAEPDQSKRLRTVFTDAKGVFRFETPIGSVRLWHPKLKPGYWMAGEHNQMPAVTSIEKPVATLEIPVQRGAVWPIQATVEGGVPDNTQFFLNVMEMEDDSIRKNAVNGKNWALMKMPSSSTAILAADGQGSITQCGGSGKLWVNVQAIPKSDARGKRQFTGIDVHHLSVEMLVDLAFDPMKVESVMPIGSTDDVQLTDRNGAKATIGHAEKTIGHVEAKIQDGHPILTFKLKRDPLHFTEHEFFGRVIDKSGAPVAEVRVSPAVGIVNGGSTQLDEETQTDRDGKFRLKIQLPESKDEQVASLIFMKDGYAAEDSTTYPLAKKPDAAIDLGDFTLEPGHSIPVHVTDTDGRPLAGAIVEPLNSYATRQNPIRTDQEGRGQLRNLPAGVVSLSVTYGKQYDRRKVVISLNDADNEELKLRLKPAPNPPTSTVALTRKDPIAIGSDAPELSIRSWIDGKQHRLSDYRGRVVVIDFWGVWCGGCVRTIPLMRDLAAKYESKNVVFLAIHTPDGDYDQINKLRKTHNWQTLTGIENGQEQSDGLTSSNYGVNGYPTFVVIDADGKVAFNSGIQPKDEDAFMKEMQQLATSLKIPWPIPENSEEESNSYMNRIFDAKFSSEIDKVLMSVKNE